ncbi:hypothetical protein [Streptomyces sp. NPDC049813]|uniref:hypothetical protein n=1 Tax=Streptomyces sp. NPDC049813 TaxID=3365597 RepID=UPI0037B4B49C
MFEALGRIERVVGDLRAGRVGGLSIGYFSPAGSALLAPVVAALRTEFSELRLDLLLTEYHQDEPDLGIFVEGAGRRAPRYGPRASRRGPLLRRRPSMTSTSP